MIWIDLPLKKIPNMVAQEVNILDELAELLASMDPERVLQFKASAKAQRRMEELLWKNKENTLSTPEKQELERYMVVEHIVRLAKARARRRAAAA